MVSVCSGKHTARVLYEIDRCPLCLEMERAKVLAQQMFNLRRENDALRTECRALIEALQKKNGGGRSKEGVPTPTVPKIPIVKRIRGAEVQPAGGRR